MFKKLSKLLFAAVLSSTTLPALADDNRTFSDDNRSPVTSSHSNIWDADKGSFYSQEFQACTGDGKLVKVNVYSVVKKDDIANALASMPREDYFKKLDRKMMKAFGSFVGLVEGVHSDQLSAEFQNIMNATNTETASHNPHDLKLDARLPKENGVTNISFSCFTS